jgi:SAM-dependent methyltransferase
LKMIKDIIVRKGSCVWVDLGCGNGIALRQAKIMLEKDGIDPDLLRTYGVDVLPSDLQEIEQDIHDQPDIFSKELTGAKYSPMMIQADATQVDLKEKADLITAVEVTQWVKDPLELLRNAIFQLNEGGIIGFSKTRRLKYSGSEHPSSDPEKISIQADEILMDRFERQSILSTDNITHPGLEIVTKSYDSIVLKKTMSDVQFGENLKLISRGSWLQGYLYLYGNI